MHIPKFAYHTLLCFFLCLTHWGLAQDNLQGADCNTAIQIGSIPARFPMHFTDRQSNLPLPEDICFNTPMNGIRYYSYTPEKDICLNISSTNNTGQGGIAIYQGCPTSPTSTCLNSVICPRHECNEIALNQFFQAGTPYFIIVFSTGEMDHLYHLNIKESTDPEFDCGVCKKKCIECQNIGFDQANFIGWKGASGNYDFPDMTSGILNSDINNELSRHTIINKDYIDPILGNLLNLNPPTGSDYAFRLGNSMVGAEAEQISFTLTVTPENEAVRYYYALVLQDPGHTMEEQPYFEVRVEETNGPPLPCGDITFYADNNPDFEFYQGYRGPIVYRQWSPVVLALDDYMGKEITITFTVKDCAQGGHFAYAYLDADCFPLEITQYPEIACKGDSVLISAPEGFKEYLWNTGETTREIYTTMPQLHEVTMTPFANALATADCDITKTIQSQFYSISNDNYILYSPSVLLEKETASYFAQTDEGWTAQHWFNTSGMVDSFIDYTQWYFPDPMLDTMCLSLIDTNTCMDTICVEHSVGGIINIYIPNAFSPNNDPFNETWAPVLQGIKSMKGTIYNRWGEVVFTFNSLSDRWTGEYKRTYNGMASFNYTFEFVDVRGEVHIRTGIVSLIP